ncbi:nitroreductase family deazaflavin-dependent oxidoreductase [Gordonia sp. TBRC 11910]|uniref:Nitroreductase family deazaflavin-dependent oxidoreductase n=1 Tax=Gordonia asplenii TaxID=2725283 RepID=A0A848KMM4_9ACTN|nr:nitroreductase family deazaflavin-dependent oxidoreductase [Gordonia asplenii]NMN99925.1 nitroreductase family deazaflavin-dependent oxidoreductase [Gordonia asplenii]
MALHGEYAPSTSDWARKQAETIEESGGTEGTSMNGIDVVVLTTLGAKSGKLRKTPLIRVEHDGEYLAVASLGGAPNNPQWYHNVVAHPEVDLRDGERVHSYTARELSGAERSTWWDRAVDAFPNYAEYQTRTSRVIPIFLLTPNS